MAVAQPAWQLPTTIGRARLCGWRAITSSRKRSSASITSDSVWPSSGSGRKVTKYTGWPARGSTTTTGRACGSLSAAPAGGSTRSRA